MKTYKLFFALLLGAFFYTGCSTNEQPVNPDSSNAVTFQFDAKKVFDTKALTAIEGYQQCMGDIAINTMAVDITLVGPETKTLTNVPVKLFGDNLKTDPIELKSGTYTVTNVIVILDLLLFMPELLMIRTQQQNCLFLLRLFHQLN